MDRERGGIIILVLWCYTLLMLLKITIEEGQVFLVHHLIWNMTTTEIT